MAQVADFLSRVVPWPKDDQSPGWVNLHWFTPKKAGMRGRPFKKVSELVSLAQWCAANPTKASDVYFCLSLQSATGREYNGFKTALRDARFALSLRSLWLDIDVKPDGTKGYPTKADAINALNQFCKAASMPIPSAIVGSGGGFHVYWFSDRDLPLTEWKPYAEGLKQLTQKHAFKCDTVVIADAARVLRVPGTFNYKTNPPQAAKLMGPLGADYNFEQTFAHLLVGGVTAPLTATVSVFAPGFKPPGAAFAALGNDTLASGLRVHDDTPLDWKGLIEHCPHFQDAYRSGGADYPEPLWSMDLLACTFLKDGKKLAHAFSRGYAGNTKEQTLVKYEQKEHAKADRGLGWPSCKSFEDAGCKQCATCTFHGKIKSPLNLCERPAQQAQSTPAPGSHLPEGYIEQHGVIYEVRQKDGKDNLLRLFLAPVYNFRSSVDGIIFTTKTDLRHTREVTVRTRDMGRPQSLVESLGDQQCKFNPDNSARLGQFLMSFKAKLDAASEAIRTKPYGWTFNSDDPTSTPTGFAYGGKVIRDDGTIAETAVADKVLVDDFKPSGDIKPWMEVHNLITQQNRPANEVIMALSFAAPLFRFTGEKAALVCPYGDTGAHKSTAASAGVSVWGNAKRAKMTPNNTENWFIERVGSLRNLPLYIDELTDAEKMEKVRPLITMFTEAMGKGRLSRSGNARDVSDWQLLVCTCSNQSFADYVINKRGNTSANYKRLFEFEVRKGMNGFHKSTGEVGRMLQELEHQYGMMGMKYASLLGRAPAGIIEVTKHVETQFLKSISNYDVDERFWLASCVAIISGARLANELGCTFHIKEMWGFLKEAYEGMRIKERDQGVKGDSAHACENILSRFFGDTVNQFLVQDTYPKKRGRAALVNVFKGPPQPQREKIVLSWITDDRELHIAKDPFMEWMAKNNIDSNAAIAGLKQHYNATNMRRVMTNGTPYSGLGKADIIVVPVPPSTWLWEMLWKYVPLEKRPAQQAQADALSPPASPTPDSISSSASI